MIDVDSVKGLQAESSRESVVADETQLMMITCFHYLMVLNQAQPSVYCKALEGSRFPLQPSTTPGDLADEFCLFR